MEKLTEKILFERGTPKSTKVQHIKSLNLSRLGLKGKDLPVELLSRLTSLETLDLSGNLLQEIPEGLSFPALRVLNLSNNDMEDVTSIQSLTSLEEINLEDNLYLTLNDQHKVIFLLPKLHIFNGKDISTMANHIRHVTSGILRKRVTEIWEASFKLPNPPTAESLAKVEKAFVNDACFRVKYGPSSLSLYTKWRVEMLAREHFQSLTHTVEKGPSQNIPTPSKDSKIPLTPFKRKSRDIETKGDERCSPKRMRLLALTPKRDSPKKSFLSNTSLLPMVPSADPAGTPSHLPGNTKITTYGPPPTSRSRQNIPQPSSPTDITLRKSSRHQNRTQPSSPTNITPKKSSRHQNNSQPSTPTNITPKKSSRLQNGTQPSTPKNETPKKSSRLQNSSPLSSLTKIESPHKSRRLISTSQTTEKRSDSPLKQKRSCGKEGRKPSTPQQKQRPTNFNTEALIHQQPSGTISEDPICLQPLHVLQCHSKQDDPDDFKTQIWSCAFEPTSDSSGSGSQENLVATSGGETICLIDCETGCVMKKYKVPGEEFFSLAWSSLQMSVREGVTWHCSILAAAGKRGMVKLLHPHANLAFGEFRSSRRAISILRFSPLQTSYLFCGSYDNKISLWDIGSLDADYNFKASQLLVLETTSSALHLALPPSSPDKHLIAACDDGVQCFNIQLNANTQKRSMQMEVTFPVFEKSDKSNNYRTIDGLCFLSDDVVASKSHMQGSIYLWSWKRTLESSSRKKKVSAEILAELQWSSTDVPYLSLNSCPSHGYLVGGDDKGRLWTYHVTEHMKAMFKSGKPISTTEVLEWPLPVRAGLGPVEGPSINSVAMTQDLRYLVGVSDKNMVVVWKRVLS